MATAITPVTKLPTTSGSIAGQFTAGAPLIRLSVALTAVGADNLVLIRQQSSGYWATTPWVVSVQRSGTDFTGAAMSVDIPVNDTANYHVLSESGFAVANGSTTLENLAPSTGIALPAITGDTIALLNAAQSLNSKTLVSPVVSTGLTASGSAANDFSSSTGDFLASTGAYTWAGASGKAGSLVANAAALTLTGGAASTWSTSAGALTVSGFAGVNLQVNGATVADVGATSAAALTLAAGKSLAGAAGAGALSLGSMTGATALPTGNLSWAGAATKTLTLLAASTSSVGTSAGAFSIDAGGQVIIAPLNATGVTIGHGSAPVTVNSSAAAALAVGANGATNPVLTVNAATGSVATGLSVTGAAAAAGLALAVTSSGSNESLTIAAKGTGSVTINPGVAVPAGGSAACGILASATAALGVYFGSGAPTLSAAQGSVYFRTDGSSASTRAYIASNSVGTWIAVTTAS